MNRRDFVSVARSLRATRPDAEDAIARQQWEWTVDRLAEDFGASCAHFDAAKFLKAAGK